MITSGCCWLFADKELQGYIHCFHSNPQKPTNKSKMGAEKVSMNIVVVGQVQSSKAIKTVAKATPATNQFMNC
ncbi:hypothetical protein ACI65C_007394 [Semiaphis heraclei]